MPHEQQFWLPARGPFRTGGEGWHWQADRLERHYSLLMAAEPHRFVKSHFFDLYSLSYSMLHTEQSSSGIVWRFEHGFQTTPKQTPFTIFSVQTRPDITIANMIYGRDGRAVAQVDFLPHGTARSGHWHPLLPGSFFHLGHYPWETCPMLWSLVPKQAGRPRCRVGLRSHKD